MELESDIDWNNGNAQNNALSALDYAFGQDPMLQLFDGDARRRLAGYVVHHLAAEFGKRGDMTMYLASNVVTYNIIPSSPYGAFGHGLANQIGWIVQKALYPATYAEA